MTDDTKQRIEEIRGRLDLEAAKARLVAEVRAARETNFQGQSVSYGASDGDEVAVADMEALLDRLDAKDAEIAELQAENERLDEERTDLANELSAQVSMRDAEIASLRARLETPAWTSLRRW